MKTVNKLNEKNISLFSGLIGFVLIFILFDFHIYTVELLLPESADIIESYEYTYIFYSLQKAEKYITLLQVRYSFQFL